MLMPGPPQAAPVSFVGRCFGPLETCCFAATLVLGWLDIRTQRSVGMSPLHVVAGVFGRSVWPRALMRRGVGVSGSLAVGPGRLGLAVGLVAAWPLAPGGGSC